MRTLCTWVALSTVFGAHVGPAVHALTAEHVTCPEHGELLEAGEHVVPTDVGSPAGPSIASGEAAKRDAHEHDHCTLATYCAPAAVTVLSSWTASETSWAVAASARALVALPPKSILRIAPKQSPPLA